MRFGSSLSRRSLLSVPPFLLPALGAQFTTEVNVVNLFATVRNKEGQIIKDLAKDDFLLEEEGRPQIIRYFSQESNVPLTVGLLIDTSPSTLNVFPEEQSASQQFLRQVFRPAEDRAFIIHFDVDAKILQGVTGSRADLERALANLGAIAQLKRRGTVLYDAVYLAAAEITRKEIGRKALILVSDGYDEGSRVRIVNALDAVHRADTIVYTISFDDPAMELLRMSNPSYRANIALAAGPAVMRDFAEETGGRFFKISDKTPIRGVFELIEEDMRNLYSLGYTPATVSRREFRRIKLRTRQKGLTVQTRRGYYPA